MREILPIGKAIEMSQIGSMRHMLLSGLVGAMIGHVTAKPTERLIDQVTGAMYGAEVKFESGKALRRKAIPEGRDELHKQANEMLRKSSQCGHGLAEVYLVQAYCFGWGVEKNPRLALSKLQELYTKQRLPPNLILDPTFCPQG